MPSPEFSLLQENLGKLRGCFLNFGKRDLGDYSEEELLKCRAFIAFSHAEVEIYLESLATKILAEAIDSWSQRGQVGIVAAAILAFRRSEKTSVPSDPAEPSAQNSLSQILNKAFVVQRGVISANHGIKRDSFAAIFMPLGLRHADIDENLMLQLDLTGTHRGEMVHKNTSSSLLKIRDPFLDEEKDINSLLAELARFDEAIASLGLYSAPHVQREPVPVVVIQADTQAP